MDNMVGEEKQRGEGSTFSGSVAKKDKPENYACDLIDYVL